MADRDPGCLYNDLIGRRIYLGAAAVIFDGLGRALLVRHSYVRRGRELRGVYYELECDQHHFAFLCRLPDGRDPTPSSAEIVDCAY